MNKTRLGLVVVTLLFSAPAIADEVEDAYRLCRVMDATGLLSEPCDVSGWNSSVDVSIDTTSAEARTICAGIGDMIRGDLSFGGKWQMRIFSPFSGDNPDSLLSAALKNFSTTDFSG